ncbi:LytR/AlgR family response regulator transcription factor [Bowmanella denitrificans]|uniref:LytR/AlgR family response regulator transcription factor n=1 Tax=Bowmanella denitrificans TaxID=366582 RepID=UPI000C99C57B|nr:LytTR family DNA-binding domain-containing protein [Bowmanella denitrificans]
MTQLLNVKHWPVQLGSKDVLAPLVGWCGFVLVLTCYCLVYKQVLFASSFNFSWAVATETLMWACREWAVWMVLTPLAFACFRLNQKVIQPQHKGWLCCGVLLLIALLAKLAMELLASTGDAFSSLVVLFPRYLAASLVVMWVWRKYLRPCSAQPKQPTLEPAGPNENASIMVSKGSGQVLLALDAIQWLAASGNYVEVHTADGQYLLRATMQQLQEQLPARLFLRIHRSYMVNLGAIDCIQHLPSGSGKVLLKSGHTLALSKSYRKALQQFKFQAVS